MEVKNYKELCKLLDEPIKSGNSKISQIKYWQNIIDFEREEGNLKYKIIKVGNIKNYNSHRNNSILNKECCRLPIEYADKAGVYIIHNNLEAYIGSTQNFKQRFSEHYKNKSNIHHYPHDILHNGGVFEILWVAENKKDIQELVNKEQYYLDYYKSLGKYNVVNIKTRCISWQKNYEERNFAVSNVSSKYTGIKSYKRKGNIVSARRRRTYKQYKIKVKSTDIEKINELIIMYDIALITVNYVYFKERSPDKEVNSD